MLRYLIVLFLLLCIPATAQIETPPITPKVICLPLSQMLNMMKELKTILTMSFYVNDDRLFSFYSPSENKAIFILVKKAEPIDLGCIVMILDDIIRIDDQKV